MAELAPLLWFDRDRDGKRSLTKLYNPLIASLLTQSNLKSVLLKRMSKFVPKLLIGLATALPNINSDMILLKVKLFFEYCISPYSFRGNCSILQSTTCYLFLVAAPAIFNFYSIIYKISQKWICLGQNLL